MMDKTLYGVWRCFLTPILPSRFVDYHRLKRRFQPRFRSSPEALLDFRRVDVYVENKRCICPIETEQFGLVLLIAVAATMVGLKVSRSRRKEGSRFI